MPALGAIASRAGQAPTRDSPWADWQRTPEFQRLVAAQEATMAAEMELAEMERVAIKRLLSR